MPQPKLETLQKQLEAKTDAALTKIFETKFSEVGIQRYIEKQIDAIMKKSLLSILGLTNKWGDVEFTSTRDSPNLLMGLIADKTSAIVKATEAAFTKEIKSFKPTIALNKEMKKAFLKRYGDSFNWAFKDQINLLLAKEATTIAEEQIAEYRKSVGLPTDDTKKPR